MSIVALVLLLALFRAGAVHAYDGSDVRQRLISAYFDTGYTYHLILCFLAGIHDIVISLRTLKRLLRKMNLRRRGLQNSQRTLCRCIMEELGQSGSLLGYRAMHQRLQQVYGLRIAREDVRRMLNRLDPEGVAQRRRHRLNRRQYYTKGPNYCWHIDGNDKLKPYGFSIHGCIDGFSRKVIWLEVCPTNKDSFVIAGYYLQAVIKYGCPKIVRADRGSENAKIAFMQPFLRRHGTDGHSAENSFHYGRSIHNQRIERWWGSLYQWCTLFWIDSSKCDDSHLSSILGNNDYYLQSLKEGGHYDDSDIVHRDCLKFAFTDIIQADLNRTIDAWNTHRIRTGRNRNNGIPDQLYFLPEVTGYEDCSYQYDDQDFQLCERFACDKPQPTSQEFTDLATIIMDEENFEMPATPQEALELYIDLVDIITNM